MLGFCGLGCSGTAPLRGLIEGGGRGRSYTIEAGETGNEARDAISSSAGNLCDFGRGAEDCARGGGEEIGGVREYCDPCSGIILCVGREVGEQQRVPSDNEDERGARRGAAEGSVAATFV